MNLVMLSPTFHPDRGGAESLAEDLAALVVARGHAAAIVTASGAVEGASAANLASGVRVFRVPHPPPHRPPFAAPSVLAAGMRMRRWYRELLSTGQVDAVCIMRVEESCRDVLALRHRFGFRLSVYVHGAELRLLQRRWRRYREVLRRALVEADAVVAVSEDIRRETLEFAPEVAASIDCIPNGIDVAAVRAMPPATWPRPYVLFAGRLATVKNPRTLIAGFARAAAELAALDLLVAGEGEERAALTAEVARLGLTERVRFLGGVDRGRVHALMRGACCLVVPSHAEGHPLVVLEALAAGLPVVASAVQGRRDLVGEEHGAQFPSDDDVALGRLLVRYAGNGTTVRAQRAALAALDGRSFDLGGFAERHLAAIGGPALAGR